jgi:hypothetical protein
MLLIFSYSPLESLKERRPPFIISIRDRDGDLKAIKMLGVRFELYHDGPSSGMFTLQLRSIVLPWTRRQGKCATVEITPLATNNSIPIVSDSVFWVQALMVGQKPIDLPKLQR